MNEPKRSFLDEMFVRNAIRAAFAHANVFEASAQGRAKLNVRSDLEKQLRTTARSYRNRVSGRSHEANLERIAKAMSFRHGRHLRGGRMRIGIVQKALNVYLKYLWCVGSSTRPPHCPFDRHMIRLAAPKARVPDWTKADKIRDYREWVAGAAQLSARSGFPSIAEWELEEFNKLVESQTNASGAADR